MIAPPVFQSPPSFSFRLRIDGFKNHKRDHLKKPTTNHRYPQWNLRCVIRIPNPCRPARFTTPNSPRTRAFRKIWENTRMNIFRLRFRPRWFLANYLFKTHCFPNQYPAITIDQGAEAVARCVSRAGRFCWPPSVRYPNLCHARAKQQCFRALLVPLDR